MESSKTTISICVDIALTPMVAFDVFVEELAAALVQQGMSLETGPNGRIIQNEFEVGRVLSWERGESIRLQWRQASWQKDELTDVEIRLEPVESGTRVTISHRGWGGLISHPSELVSWFAGEVVAPFLRATAPLALGDWLTDRVARRPSGAQARTVYRDPLYHYPNFYVILSELALTPDDYLIEVGCGGGAFLKEALKSGCRAAAIDHSPDMVQLAQQENHDAIANGRLEIQQASADHLPFPKATFTCAAMTGVLGFLLDPVATLREIRRVLVQGGRLVMLGCPPEMRGTIAAPEPAASRLHFYTDDELRQLALDAGFEEANVVRRNLEPFARQAGVPEEHLALFAGSGAPFLLARRT